MTTVAFRVRAALPAKNLCRCLSSKATNGMEPFDSVIVHPDQQAWERICSSPFLLYFFLFYPEQTNPVRGMKDRFGEENRRFKWIVDKGAHLSNLYGFEQVRAAVANCRINCPDPTFSKSWRSETLFLSW